MLQVGPFEMTDTEESFWEIVKNFGFLVSEFHYEVVVWRSDTDVINVCLCHSLTDVQGSALR